MSRHWRMVPTTEGTMCVYVGVHAIDWQPEWGPPSVAFIDDVEDETATLRAELEACRGDALNMALGIEGQKRITSGLRDLARRIIQEADNER